MSNKFKLDYYQRPGQSTSPYMQLLQAKKKIFGYKYEVARHDKHPHNKSLNVQSQPAHKHSKTQSHQKERPKTTKHQHSRKKRSHTQHAQERMHESLFLNREGEQSQGKESKHQATKSLFAPEGWQQQSVNPLEFLRNYKQASMGQAEGHPKSQTQQVEGRRERSGGRGIPVDRLEITEIDELVNLIDHCVEEANDYISYLGEKIQVMKAEMDAVREESSRIVKMKDAVINEKEHQIDRLRKQLFSAHHHIKPNSAQPVPPTLDTKQLLEAVEHLTQENAILRQKIGQSGMENSKNQQEKNDIYSQIHNKIDILKISIDKKGQEGGQEGTRDSRKAKVGKAKFYK